MTLVGALDVQPWCTKHRVMLAGMPRLTWDSKQQCWSYTLGDCTCPAVSGQSECVTSWGCVIGFEPMTPATPAGVA